MYFRAAATDEGHASAGHGSVITSYSIHYTKLYEALLNGPQLAGHGVSQDDVDKMFEGNGRNNFV